ncbi:hypothetical protein LMG26696_01267 [Achromobacter pulmonis]|nr:hypothetical protein LMG26696_01267 [Achromobacter pulmonis]
MGALRVVCRAAFSVDRAPGALLPLCRSHLAHAQTASAPWRRPASVRAQLCVLPGLRRLLRRRRARATRVGFVLRLVHLPGRTDRQRDVGIAQSRASGQYAYRVHQRPWRQPGRARVMGEIDPVRRVSGLPADCQRRGAAVRQDGPDAGQPRRHIPLSIRSRGGGHGRPDGRPPWRFAVATMRGATARSRRADRVSRDRFGGGRLRRAPWQDEIHTPYRLAARAVRPAGRSRRTA